MVINFCDKDVDYLLNKKVEIFEVWFVMRKICDDRVFVKLVCENLLYENNSLFIIFYYMFDNLFVLNFIYFFLDFVF